MGTDRPITHVDAAAHAVAEQHRHHRDWGSTREAIEILAHIVQVEDDDREAAYYRLAGRKLARAELADRVLVALGHPRYAGNEDQLALIQWSAEWTQEACLTEDSSDGCGPA